MDPGEEREGHSIPQPSFAPVGMGVGLRRLPEVFLKGDGGITGPGSSFSSLIILPWHRVPRSGIPAEPGEVVSL